MILYRYRKSCHDEDVNESSVHLWIEEFTVVAETPKGYWFVPKGGLYRRWTSKVSKSRYAYPTKKEALNNFIRRATRSISIMRYQITFSKVALDKARKEIEQI